MGNPVNLFKVRVESSRADNLTFQEIVEMVKVQIEFDVFSETDKSMAEEICLIIAEIYKLPDNIEIQINKTKMTVALVREIYFRLTFEHIMQVIENLKKVTYEIKSMKSYLRTALYKVVFEMESVTLNQFNVLR